MAKQTGPFTFTGKLDNMIGYRRNGIHFVRSMPQTVRQTSATRQASRNFGIASKKGKLIRRAVTPLLNIRCNGSLVNRLNKALIQGGSGRLQEMTGFRFNEYTGLEKFFTVQPVMSSNGRLTLPAQDLRLQKFVTVQPVMSSNRKLTLPAQDLQLQKSFATQPAMSSNGRLTLSAQDLQLQKSSATQPAMSSIGRLTLQENATHRQTTTLAQAPAASQTRQPITHLEIKAIAVRINFAERRITGSRIETAMIDLSQSFEGLELETEAPGKGTLLLILQIKCYKNGIAVEDRRFMAADIMAVVAPIAPKKAIKENNPHQKSIAFSLPLPVSFRKRPYKKMGRRPPARIE